MAKAWTIFTAKSAKKTFKTSRSYPHPLVSITWTSKHNIHCIASDEAGDIGIVAIPHLSRDLLTGSQVNGSISLEPTGVAIIQFDKSK